MKQALRSVMALSFRRGVVILSNSTNSIDDSGRHLLEAQYPLSKMEAPK